MNKAKPAQRRERSIVRILLTACTLVAAGFAGAWLYLQYAEQQHLNNTYTPLKRVAISRAGHSIAAGFAVKTSDADARWALQNRDALEAALQQSLLRVDPQQVLAPNGLKALQQRLPQEINTALATSKVREILITDFLVSEGDF
jgi:flagellar basal body-associated protein FliL